MGQKSPFAKKSEALVDLVPIFRRYREPGQNVMFCRRMSEAWIAALIKIDQMHGQVGGRSPAKAKPRKIYTWTRPSP